MTHHTKTKLGLVAGAIVLLFGSLTAFSSAGATGIHCDGDKGGKGFECPPETTTTTEAPTTTTTEAPPETTTTTQPELPLCPPVTYDGVLPQDGGTGPVWPEGEPTEDCQGNRPPTTATTTPPATPTVVEPSFTG